MVKNYLTIFCIFFIANYTQAQLFLTGNVFINGVAIPHVNVCLLNAGKIETYTIADKEGNFKLKLPATYNADSNYQLQFTCVGFQKKLQDITQGIA
jgi:hypothetical protein